MQKRTDQIIFSPTDINVFFESHFASWMDRFHLEYPGTVVPDAPPPEQKLVAQLGIAHERRHLASLVAAGLDVLEAPERCDLDTTLGAMRAGRAVIYQGKLAQGPFEGYADFLYRVETPSALGAWSYEVADTKLARKPKPYFLLQLCAYSKMLERIQGVRPSNVHVIGGDRVQTTFPTDDYFFYFLSLEREFLEWQRTFDPEKRPVPDGRADHGRWSSVAQTMLDEADHLCRVAGISSAQMSRLADAGVTTLAGLAGHEGPGIRGMDSGVFDRLRIQARLQMESAGLESPLYELVTPTSPIARYGLALLPPASPLDVYFDMEGYPFAEGGLEYLFGATYIDRQELKYVDCWGHDRAGEKRAFEAFVDLVYARWREDPAMHVYHYGAYERTAVRRLMGQHATREDEIDELLTAEVFVDLLRVVKQSVRIGEPGYSLKNVERLYRPARSGEVATAAQSVVEYSRWLELRDGESIDGSAILEGIRAYNRDDCESTLELRRWLAARQAEAGVTYVPPPAKSEKKERPDPARDAIEALIQRLLGAIPLDRSSDDERWRVQELLAWLAGFHRREGRPLWGEVYDRQKQTDQELAEDGDCLGALARTATPPAPQKQSLLYEYCFDPDQDTKLTQGSPCFIADDLARTTIASLDQETGLVRIKLEKSRPSPGKQISLIPDEYVDAKKIAASIASIAESWDRSGCLPPALDTFLRRRPPRIEGVEPGQPILAPDEADETSVTRILAGLSDSAIAVQGPPGAGKTRVASAAILALVDAGRRIGISSNSHKAIQKLIEEVQKRAHAAGASLRIVKVNRDKDDDLVARGAVVGASSMSDVDFDGAGAPQIVGGTAWAFADPSAIGRFDYLFVDEAGQVSLANLVGMSPCASNLVLLGDQMQLGQPIRGSHPGESGQSALEYLLSGHRTIPEHLGIFLGKTWRLHPDLCHFVSDAFYDGKLHSRPEAAERVALVGSTIPLRVPRQAGIVFVPVFHEGNDQESEEEVTQIQTILAELRGRALTGVEGDRAKRPPHLDDADVLIVAPYNMQVRRLRASIPGVRAGTVDKFQGQEAPVVIVSMCASTGENLRRGVEFLFSPKRLNVALSRAQSLAIVVGSPELARTRVTSVQQMKLVNLFCRIVEEGNVALRS